MAADEIIIVDVEYNTGEAVKNVNLLTDSIVENEIATSNLSEQNRQLKKELKKTDEELQKEGKTREEITAKLKKNSKEIEINRQSVAKEKKERKDNIKLIQSESGSRDKLTKTISKLINERNSLNDSTEEGAKKSEELRVKIDALNDKLLEGSTKTEKNKLSIGGYSDAIKEAFGELGVLNNVLDKNVSFQEKFNNLIQLSGKSFKGATTGIKGGSKALNVFKIALAATGIGLIVVVLGALVAAFTKTQDGANKISKIFAQVSAVVDTIIGRFAKLGGAITKIFTGDFSGAINDTKEAFSGLSEEIAATVKEAGQLADLTVKFKNENREIEKQIATLEARRELERGIAEDDTTGFARRAEFAKKEAATIIEIADTKKKLAQNDLTLIEREINALKKKNLAISDEQKDALKDAQIALEAAENEKLLTQRDQEELRRKGVRDLFEFELDFLIDTQSKHNQINTEQINNTKLDFGARKALLEETARLSEESFRRQEKAVEEFTGKKVDFDSLAAESDAKTIFNRLKLLDLDDITLNRSREIIQERKLLLNDFANLEKQLQEEKEAKQLLIDEAETERQILKAEQDSLNSEEFIALQEEELDTELALLDEGISEKQSKRLDAHNQELEDEQNLQDRRIAIIQNGLNITQQLTSSLFAFQNASREADFQRQIQQAGDNDARKAQIEKKFGQRRKKDAIKQALINTALAIGNALATTVPLIPAGLIAAGIAGVRGGLELATIKKQSFGMGGQVRLPKAENGAKFGTFKGATHAQGGIDLMTSSGIPFANVQNDENFYVVKKEASDFINSLSATNQRFGGVALTNKRKVMQDGGQADIETQQDINNLTQQVVDNLPPIVVNVQDIKTGISDVNNVLEAGVI